MQADAKDNLVQLLAAHYQVVQVGLALGVMLLKKLRAFGIENALPPGDLLSGPEQERESQEQGHGEEERGPAATQPYSPAQADYGGGGQPHYCQPLDGPVLGNQY